MQLRRISEGFFFLAFLMFTNGALVNKFCAAPPLNLWRQIVWIVGLLILYNQSSKCYVQHLGVYLNFYKISFWYICILSLITVAVHHFNVVRIVYAWWLYFSGIPFVLLPVMWAKYKQPPEFLLSFFAYTGVLFCAGLILDYLMGGAITISMGVFEWTEEDLAQAGRYCFTAEAPTTFGVVICFQLICLLWKLHIERATIKQCLYIAFIFVYIVGCWFTGSRQLILAMGIVLLIAFLRELLDSRSSKRYLLIVLLALLAVAPVATRFLFSSDVYGERYDMDEIKEDDRSLKWKRGFEETLASGDVKVITIGNGVAFIQGQKALPGEVFGPHYENTFFGRISELGIFGLVSLLYPFIFFLKRCNMKKYSNALLLAFFLAFSVISFVSPNGNHPTTQMTLSLVIGFMLCQNYYFVDYHGQ